MFYILFRLQVLFNLLIFNSYYCSFTKAFQWYLFIIKNSIMVCIWGRLLWVFLLCFSCASFRKWRRGGGKVLNKQGSHLQVQPLTLLQTIFNWTGQYPQFAYLLSKNGTHFTYLYAVLTYGNMPVQPRLRVKILLKFKYEHIVWLAFQKNLYLKTRLDGHITIRERSVL